MYFTIFYYVEKVTFWRKFHSFIQSLSFPDSTHLLFSETGTFNKKSIFPFVHVSIQCIWYIFWKARCTQTQVILFLNFLAKYSLIREIAFESLFFSVTCPKQLMNCLFRGLGFGAPSKVNFQFKSCKMELFRNENVWRWKSRCLSG